jgi:hypothetical protein
MMLGKPVICYLIKNGINSLNMEWTKDCPIISATEETIYDVLKFFLKNKNLLKKYGDKGRVYALKWHSADSCAERYELIHDKIMKN